MADELAGHSTDIIAAYYQALMQWREQFAPTAEQIMSALTTFCAQLEKSIMPVRATLLAIDPWPFVLPEEKEACLRVYAIRLNWSRPIRKVSWQRLNRAQRKAAAWAWLAAKR